VVLEDVGEAPYKVDRMTRQLVLGGGLGDAAAIILGQFTGVDDAAASAIDAYFQDLADELEIPMARGLPVGHGAQNAPLPFGVATGHTARLEASGEEATLHVDGPTS
jgi:muramoyltetrapeptide carboxypeptidase